MNNSRLILLFFAIFLTHCGSNDTEKPKPKKKSKIERLKAASPVPGINYHLFPVTRNKAWVDLLEHSEVLTIILVLNRIDKSYLERLDTLVLPDKYFANVMVYSSFPGYVDALKPVKKIMLVSRLAQAVAIYQNGVLLRWGPASTGKKSTPTPIGLYFCNWKSKKIHSTENYDWILKWCFNIDNRRGVSMHEFSLPGYPASHACIRLSATDAEWIYSWADQWKISGDTAVLSYGTPVIIYGDYPYGSRKPWLNLPQDRLAVFTTEAEITNQLENFLPEILKKQVQRDSIKQLGHSNQ